MGMFAWDKDCIAQRTYVNLPLWDKYDGEGLSIFCDDVDTSHTENVKDIIQTILPKAAIRSGEIGYVKNAGAIESVSITCKETRETLPFDDFIKKYNVTLINNSTTGGNGDTILPEALYMKDKIAKYNLIMTGAAGNDNSLPTRQKYNGACIMATGCHFDKNGIPAFSNNSIGKNIDFTMFTGFQAGTSFASPFLLGMAGKLRCKYPGITQDEVKQYFKAHCKDILAVGFDIESGWGVPVMGTKTEVKITVGSKTMLVDGVVKPIDQPAIYDTITHRIMTPSRALAEPFGINVAWDDPTKTATFAKDI
jgi:hypothetical protein